VAYSESLPGFLSVIPMNETPTTYIFDFMFNQLKFCKKSRKVMFVFWQFRPEKPTCPLTLNKNTVLYGLIYRMPMCPSG
jgi:hypothetical protein